MSDLMRLVYASTAAAPFSRGSLAALLAQARTANADVQITGALVYHDEGFLQVLEGPPPAVARLYERIGQDRRHHGVTTLAEAPVAERLFGEWSMGWVAPDRLGVSGFDAELLRRRRFGDGQVDALFAAFRLCVRLEPG